jgi:hypothetical protein
MKIVERAHWRVQEESLRVWAKKKKEHLNRRFGLSLTMHDAQGGNLRCSIENYAFPFEKFRLLMMTKNSLYNLQEEA